MKWILMKNMKSKYQIFFYCWTSLVETVNVVWSPAYSREIHNQTQALSRWLMSRAPSAIAVIIGRFTRWNTLIDSIWFLIMRWFNQIRHCLYAYTCWPRFWTLSNSLTFKTLFARLFRNLTKLSKRFHSSGFFCGKHPRWSGALQLSAKSIMVNWTK